MKFRGGERRVVITDEDGEVPEQRKTFVIEGKHGVNNPLELQLKASSESPVGQRSQSVRLWY